MGDICASRRGLSAESGARRLEGQAKALKRKFIG